MSPAATYRSNCARLRLPPSPLKPPIAITGSPVASSIDAADCEPDVASHPPVAAGVGLEGALQGRGDGRVAAHAAATHAAPRH